MRPLLAIARPAFTSARVALPLALLAGLAAVCMLLGTAPRRYAISPDRLRFSGSAISAGLNNLEHTDAFGAPMSYRWTNGSARIILPNPGGQIVLRLQLALGHGRSSSVTLSTDQQQLAFTISGEPRFYHVLLKPEPDELINLQIASPTFPEIGGSRQLGVILADLGLIGGGMPLRPVLTSSLLAGLALYLIFWCQIGPFFAAELALLVELAALAWYSGPGWTQGIFATLQALGVAGCALAMLVFELARPGQLGRAGAKFLAPLPPAPSPTRGEGERGASKCEKSPSPLVGEGLGRGGSRPGQHDVVLDITILGRHLTGLGVRIGLAALFLGAAVWAQLVVVPGLASDLAIYMQASARALSGADPYQPFLIGVSYVYPPPALALFGPLTALAFPAAELGWRLLSALAIAGSVLALRRTFAVTIPTPLGGTWLLALALSFAPLWENLSIGQVNPLVLLGISLFILGHHDQRWAWIGDLGLAGAIVLKISPLLLLALPVLRADWRRCLRVGLGLLGIALLALPWFGPQRWAEFGAIVPLLFQGSNANPYNLALAAVGFRLGPIATLLGRLIATALPLLWLLRCAWDRRGDPRPLLALGVLAMTLGSSLIWYHHLIFLGVPAAWLLLDGAAGKPALAGLIGLVLVQLARPVEFGLGLGPWFAVVGYIVVLVAAIVGAGVKSLTPLPPAPSPTRGEGG
jgi:hypothetical protein